MAVIAKTDLAAGAGFDAEAARRSIQLVRPGMTVFELSAKAGDGMDGWLRCLRAKRTEACT